MPQQIEIALTEGTGRFRAVPAAGEPAPRAGTSIQHWARPTAGACEPCLVIDAEHLIVAVSPAGCDVLGLSDPADAAGRHLLSVISLLDFADGAELDASEIEKSPPVLAIKSRKLARGLMRVAATPPREWITLDAIAAPLRDGNTVVGSLTFFTDIADIDD